MGNCKIEGINDTSESLKEVKMDNYENNLMNKSDRSNYEDKLNKKYRYINNAKNSKNKEYNYKIKNNLLGKKMLNLNNIKDKIPKDKNEYNDDELVIITPRLKNNNQYSESYANEITDEFTIKNETLVYMNDCEDNKKSDIQKNNKQKSNTNKIKGKVQRKKINKNLNMKNTNQLNNKKKKKINNLSKNNIKIDNRIKKNIPNEQKNNNNIKKINNINNLNQEMPFVKIDEMEYNKINNENINNNQEFQKLNNNLIQKPENYLPKRKAKSKKNSKVFNKSYNNLLFNNFGLNPLFDSFQFSDIINASNKNPQSSTLQKQNINLENILLQQLPLINSEVILPNIERKTYKEDLELENKENNLQQKNEYANIRVPVFRKKTDFHIRNKSYNKYDFFNCNLTNDNGNDNNYFSLFNNSANLSINFIHNKFNKTAKNMNNVEPIINNKNILSDRNNKSCCNKNVNIKKNSKDKNQQIKSNPYLNYNNFNNKKSQNKKVKNKSNIQKSKKNGLSNSRSYNNIFQVNKNNKYEFNNTNSNINNMLLPLEQYRDMIEIYIPKIEKKTLICKEIINKPGNKYIFSYEKLDNFSIEQILYDGVIYKVIDKSENEEDGYQFLERYFQITKNSFRYYNNINDAISDREKPLVQFDVRHIQNIEIIDNNIFNQSKICGKKNINIIFCIYIKDNNDFFVFSHYNKYVGNNIINILEFLIRYYEDNY